MFWAFQPKRVIVPSLALRFAVPLMCALGCPLIPSWAFCPELVFMFARIVESEIASMRPTPKSGVGILNMMFGLPPCPVSAFPAGRKFGWAI